VDANYVQRGNHFKKARLITIEQHAIGNPQTARKLLPGILARRHLPWHDKMVAVLHLGGCSFGVLLAISDTAGLVDLLLGTFSYAIVLPLSGLGLLQALVGAFGLALGSRTLLRSLGVTRVTDGMFPVIRTTLVTFGMHAYSGAMTARGVWDGMRGQGSGFMRTPKRGSGLDGQTDKDPARIIG